MTIACVRSLAIATLIVVAALAAPSRGGAQQADAPLRQGDMVVIRVAGDTAMSGEIMVEQGGVVVLPRKGRVDLSHVPASQVAAVVREALSSFTLPELTSVRPMRRVTVVGELTTPGVYHLDPWSTLRDAIASGGAPGQNADATRILLRRDGLEIRIDPWQTADASDQPVASGDVLVMPRQSWFRRNVFSLVTSLALITSTIVAVGR
ncbi:MAG: SLBB domain-containing protein [Gemmatimonadetes bacterium]|nr:SLBB domain-containing protein [Gemmatimonadota bacterium]